jgi:uncharacterized protein (TIGR03435 family)
MTFDVASIRQSPPADSYMVGGSFALHSTSFHSTNLDIPNLLGIAYGVRRDQIQGLPDGRAMFNVEAKSDSAADQRLAQLTKDQEKSEQQHMLQSLLADRFKLQVHWETHQSSTYDLVVIKKGLKMLPSSGAPPTAEERIDFGAKPIPPLYQRGSSDSSFDFIAHAASIPDITNMLAGQFGRPVIDKTGLKDRYDFKLHYHDTHLTDRSADDLNPVPPLDMAIQDQLGLKLEPSKGDLRVLVIDHIEKPSEN